MTLTRRDLLRHATLGSALLAGTVTAGSAFAARVGVPRTPPLPGAPRALGEPDVYAFQLGRCGRVRHSRRGVHRPGRAVDHRAGGPRIGGERIASRGVPADRSRRAEPQHLVSHAAEWAGVDRSGRREALGPTAGRLTRGLARVGVAPADIAAVVITHAHGDHVAGLLGADGAAAFPGARVFVAADEAAFWESDRQDWTGSRVPPEGRTQATTTARKFLSGVGTRLQRASAGATLLPGVTYVPTPGARGHQAVRLTIGGETLLHIGDAVHQYALQFPRPDWTMAFDTRPAQAVTTRRALFASAAAERTRVLGYHLPFPGLGHVRAAGQGYAWVPQPWVRSGPPAAPVHPFRGRGPPTATSTRILASSSRRRSSAARGSSTSTGVKRRSAHRSPARP